jgi:1-acyl-sn-glycerol-3-phosphate acyltransferase
MTILRSALFLVWFLAVSLLLHIAALPLVFMPRRHLTAAAKLWARMILFGLKWIAGLRYDISGREHIPSGGALIAAKHFTTWETIALLTMLGDPTVVLKRELLRIPLYGWYAERMGMIAIDRAKGASAIRSMRDTARKALKENRQIVIFPEGTRVAVGAPPAYKPGVAALYALLGVSCVPVALNSGLFWTGPFLRRPGTIKVEFLPPIPPGLPRDVFMETLESCVESATNRLLERNRVKCEAVHP